VEGRTRWSLRARGAITARVLRDGVLLSFALLLVGTISLVVADRPADDLHASDLKHAASQIRDFDLSVLIHLGLIVLMLTPFARMVVLLYEFARDRESAFVAISLGVLLLMIASIIIGLR